MEDQENKLISSLSVSKFLLDSGLLFQINRVVLHPLGLCLGVTLNNDDFDAVSEDKEVLKIKALQDKGGEWLFDDLALREGSLKYAKYMAEKGEQRLQKRQQDLGYVVQDISSVYKEKISIGRKLRSDSKSLKKSAVVSIVNTVSESKQVDKESVKERNLRLRQKVDSDSYLEQREQKKERESDIDMSAILNTKLPKPEINNNTNVLHCPPHSPVSEPLKGGGNYTFCSKCGIILKDPDLNKD